MNPAEGGFSLTLRRGIVLAILAAAGAWTLATLPPPRDVAPESGFDMQRAMAHLEFIALHPRPLASPHHRAVREYLIDEFRALGLYLDVQDTRISHPRILRGLPVQVINVVARLPGTHGAEGRAVMLAAHYDSTHLNAAASHGAGDDGAAVAALLEVARVLAEDPPRNDVIFLITDAEERGLLGARAFVKEHHWLDHVGVVFNFEARGTSGPSLMFQTSRGNAWLVDQYARVAPHPVTSSIGYEIYRLMPNNTDFTIFRDAGIQGLNFAFIGDYKNYHTAGDIIENLDLRSMRHHGVQALALARHFGNMDLTALPDRGDAIYLNIGTLGVVRYPQRWSLPLAIAAAGAAVLAVILLKRRGLLRIRGIAGSSSILLVNLLLAVGVGVGIVYFVPTRVLDLHENYSILGFTILSTLITLGLMLAFRRRLVPTAMAATALLVWAALAVVSAALVPAASYLLIFPTLAAAIGMMLISSRLLANAIVITLASLPLVLLLTPVVYLAFLGLRLRLAPTVVVVIVISLWMLLPQLMLIARLAPAPARSQPTEDHSAVSGGGGA